MSQISGATFDDVLDAINEDERAAIMHRLRQEDYTGLDPADA